MSGNGSNGNGTTRDIVAKLWNLCHVLRDDGISYSDYVTELTFLLFLKMLAETGHEERLPKGYRWTGLARREGLDQLEHYRQLLLDLGNPATTKDQLVLSIFTDAQTKLRKPTNLKSLTDAIDKLDWFSAREEGLGNLYEGLLEKNAACHGLLHYLAVAYPQLVWNAFGSWLRTVRPGIPPSELVVATALRQRLPEFLLNTEQTNILAKFIAERQDTNKMQTFRLAA